MRLIEHTAALSITKQRRRGMTFIEVISSLIVVTLMCTMVIGTGSVFLKLTREMAGYSKLQLYTITKLENITDDLNNGFVIDGIDYNDNGGTSGVIAEVYVTDVSDDEKSFGKPLYLVELKMTAVDADVSVTNCSLVREGCSAHAS